jgi:hypothetical protein
VPGTYAQAGPRFTISRRAFADASGREPPRRIAVTLAANSVSTLVDADSAAALDHARLDPARIATLYGAEQEERRIARLDQLPPLLVAGLQAVEDRELSTITASMSFPSTQLWPTWPAMSQAAAAGQQLVKNLFLAASASRAKISEACSRDHRSALRQAPHPGGVLYWGVPGPAGWPGSAGLPLPPSLFRARATPPEPVRLRCWSA